MHQIEYIEFSTRKAPKTIVKECCQRADRNGDYKGQITSIRFKDTVINGYNKAVDYLESIDNGWYDNVAVKMKDNGKLRWLVKIEYHC